MSSCTDFLVRASLETRLRCLRAETAKIYGALGFAQVELGAGVSRRSETAHADWLGAMLDRVAALAALIVASPAAARTLAAAKSKDADAFERHFADVDAAIARSEARSESRRALAVMERWCEPGWIHACEAHIAKEPRDGPGA